MAAQSGNTIKSPLCKHLQPTDTAYSYNRHNLLEKGLALMPTAFQTGSQNFMYLLPRSPGSYPHSAYLTSKVAQHIIPSTVPAVLTRYNVTHENLSYVADCKTCWCTWCSSATDGRAAESKVRACLRACCNQTGRLVGTSGGLLSSMADTICACERPW